MLRNLSLYLAASLVAVSGFFVGCSEDEATKQENPTITIDQATTSAAVEGIAPIKLKFVANSGPDGKELDKAEIVYTISSVPGRFNFGRTKINARSFNYDTTFSSTDADLTINAAITVTAEDGKTATRTVTFTTKKKATVDPGEPTPARDLTMILNSTTPFYSTARGRSSSAAEAQANANLIDIAWFYSGTSQNNIISPVELASDRYTALTAAANGNTRITWTGVGTMFKTATDADFDAAKADQSKIKTAYDNGALVNFTTGGVPAGTRMTEESGTLSEDNVYSFRGANGKYGLLKVSNLGANVNGTNSFDILIEN